MEWGGEFIVKPVKIEGFAIGPLRKVQENNDEKVGFGGELWAPNITKIIPKPLFFK